jgi:hypothetical protein
LYFKKSVFLYPLRNEDEYRKELEEKVYFFFENELSKMALAYVCMNTNKMYKKNI